MKALIQIIAVLSIGFLLFTSETAKIKIKKESEIVIKGKSNVNKFTCEYTTIISEGSNNITYNVVDDSYIITDAVLKISSKAFDCGGRLINKDFNKLLQTKEYPHILIEPTRIKKKNNTYIITTDIQIAGKEKTYSFEIQNNKGDNYIGKLSLNIEDFEMDPPNKLLGVIKIDPHIDINFDLDLVIKNN